MDLIVRSICPGYRTLYYGLAQKQEIGEHSNSDTDHTHLFYLDLFHCI